MKTSQIFEESKENIDDKATNQERQEIRKTRKSKVKALEKMKEWMQ